MDKRVTKLEEENKEAKATIAILNSEVARLTENKSNEKKTIICRPAMIIDTSGNSREEIDPSEVEQPLNYARVAARKVIRPPRPQLTDSINKKVEEVIANEPLPVKQNDIN